MESESERETSVGCLPPMPPLGIKLTTWVNALTKNQNQQPFGVWMKLQLTETHHLGPITSSYCFGMIHKMLYYNGTLSINQW